MEVVIARHGETDWNVDGRMSGSSNGAQLNLKGYNHSRNLTRLLRGYSIDAIYCSELDRSMDTAEPTARLRGLPLIIEPRINELNFGILEGKLPDDLVLREHFAKRKFDKLRYRIPEGETYIEMAERTKPFVDEVLSSLDDFVFIVGHQSVNRTLLGGFLGLEPEDYISILQPNEVVYFLNSGSGRIYYRNTHSKEVGRGLIREKK